MTAWSEWRERGFRVRLGLNLGGGENEEVEETCFEGGAVTWALAGPRLTAEGVLQEGMPADGVKDGVERPVEPTQHQQQEHYRQCLQELPCLWGAQVGRVGAPGLECPLPFALRPQSPTYKSPPIPNLLLTQLTTFRISEAWIEGLKGKITDLFSAFRSGNRLCLP